MTSPETTKGTSPGQLWMALVPETRLIFLDGVIDGLNQGLRFCADEVCFALTTRLAREMTPENRLAIDSLIQQLRIWSKSGVTKFKYSKSTEEYAKALANFYQAYPKYHFLSPAYLLVYMDDHHGMTAEEVFALLEHSLQGFKR